MRVSVACRGVGVVLAAALFAFTTLAWGADEMPVYSGLKPEQFMKRWLVLKDIPAAKQKKDLPEPAALRRAFAQDNGLAVEQLQPQPGMKQQVGDRELTWQLVESEADIVDLQAGSNATDFAVAYAWAEIDMPEATKGVLGVGADDAVKVWLNGHLVHEHWVGRACRIDDDVVPVTFVRGKNRLLLKIQNFVREWGFCCRLMGAQSQAQKLITAVREDPDPEVLGQLLSQGLAVNGRNAWGLTAIQAARLRGETELVEFLASRGADVKAKPPSPERLTDGLFQSLFSPQGAGAAVWVARNGRVLFQKGYGMADLEHHVPVTPQTRFCIGSITKQFTAAAILKLQEQGQLQVQDHLAKYIPDFPGGEQVTLHHLLTHTSGIHSFTEKPDMAGKIGKPITAEALVDSIKQDPYDFAPGQKWHYDNSGYFLLGYLVGQISGRPYEEFLRQEFFAPLGMTNTGLYHNDRPPDHHALGYEFAKGKFSRARDWDMSWIGGAGGLYSTVGDLARWNESLFNGRVLQSSSLKAAFTPVRTEENKDDAPTEGYGYGWGITTMRGVREICHGGGVPGFTSFLLRLPDLKFTVVLLVNAAPPPAGIQVDSLARQVAEFYLAAEFKPYPVVQAKQDVLLSALDAVAGDYEFQGDVVTITREGDRLMGSVPGQVRRRLYPLSETNYFAKNSEIQLTFVKDPAGKVTQMIYQRMGLRYSAPRLERFTEAKVDPAAYDALVGRYDYGAAQVMTVTREGDRLFAQITGQPKCEIFPQSETNFFWKVVRAQVSFVKDEHGTVIKAIHHQGGGTFEAPKLR